MEGVWGCPPDIIPTLFLVRKGAGGWSKRVFHQPGEGNVGSFVYHCQERKPRSNLLPDAGWFRGVYPELYRRARNHVGESQETLNGKEFGYPVFMGVTYSERGVVMLMETMLPNILHRGKVRDTYAVDDKTLLMVATDRISAFDVVLPSGIPGKGQVLNHISGFWFDKTKHIISNHLICLADSPEVKLRFGDNELLASLPSDLAGQAMIVKKAERIDIECIVRGYITGSAWSEYRRHGTVWGWPMPENMVEGTPFPEPLFTPTTKAEEGHDQNMTHQQVIDLVGSDLAGQLEEVSKAVYSFADKYAKGKGIILADTKMEFGLLDGQLILIDELLTPDSSRFWDAQGYLPGESLPNYDKQFVRDWLSEQGWNQEPPAPSLPDDVVAKTTERYREAYYRLTGQRL